MDFRKAFDLIGHTILANKLKSLALGMNNISAEVPRGAKLGPRLFCVGDAEVRESEL